MTIRRMLALAVPTAALALVAAGAALAAGPRGVVYTYTGHLTAVGSGSLALTVEGGNRRGLRTMLGSNVAQTFSTGQATEFLKWSHGVPTVVGAGDLAAGDWVRVHVRARRGATLAEVESRAPAVVGDFGPDATRPQQPLYLFRGRLVSASATSISVDVRGGNRRGLRLLIGQPAAQTFAAGPETIFLRWQGKVPTVVSAADLKAGDAVVVRVRAAARSTLAQVESTAAVHVGEHEPANAAE